MKLILMLCFTGLLIVAPSRSEAQSQTLFGDYIVYSSFGAPKLQLSMIDGNPAAYAGGQLGVMADQRLIVAVDADWLITSHRFYDEDDSYRLSMGHGGIMMRFNFNPDDLVNYSANFTVGGGQATASPDEGSDLNSGFFLLNPNAEVNLNFTTNFRTSLGFGYRFITGTDLPAIESSDLSAPVVSLTLKFGGYFGN